MGGNHGVQIKTGIFFKNARRSGIWPDARTVDDSTVSKARLKVRWQIFVELLHKFVQLAYSLWPRSAAYYWKNMSVFAIDGSRYTLPATDQLRQEFDPDSGLDHYSKGHFPIALVSTVYDVFKRLPVARLVSPAKASERNDAKKLVSLLPQGNVILFDRGYPGYEFFLNMLQYQGYFIARCPAKSTFPAIMKFVRSSGNDAIITIKPTHDYLVKTKDKTATELRLRVIKLIRPDGSIWVYVTNLMDTRLFRKEEIAELYSRRWAIEVHYRDEKVSLEIESFHSKNSNGIRQELYAAAIMTVITRLMMVLPSSPEEPASVNPQFKYAIITMASEASVLVPDAPAMAIRLFQEILLELAKIKYHKPRNKRPSYPRITKRPMNKWQFHRRCSVAYA